MGITGNIQNNIVVMYEIKSFTVTLAAGNFFQIIYIEQITILPIVKNRKNSIIPPYYRWVVLCTVKISYAYMYYQKHKHHIHCSPLYVSVLSALSHTNEINCLYVKQMGE
jgi:hypothetical protein